MWEVLRKEVKEKKERKTTQKRIDLVNY